MHGSKVLGESANSAPRNIWYGSGGGAAAPPTSSAGQRGGCRSTYGGGATKALAGSLFLDNCEVANNTANAGAGTEIAGAAGYTSIVGISNTVISGNSAVLQGAAFNLGSTNGTTFTNVTFLNNMGESNPLHLLRPRLKPAGVLRAVLGPPRVCWHLGHTNQAATALTQFQGGSRFFEWTDQQ